MILALRALGLGDLLAGVPALRGLRRLHPEERLVLAAPRAVGEFLRVRGVVDEVLATSWLDPLPPVAAPDLAVDLHGRGPESRALLAATGPRELLGFATDGHPDGPVWVRDEHEVLRWCRLVGAGTPEDLRLGSGTGTGPVVVHPGAASGSRRWPVERWARVVRALVPDSPVVVTGTADEAHLGAALAAAGARDLCGTQSLEELARTVADARLVLSGDTGTAHLATAFGAPSVLLFGPTPPHWWGPAVDPHLHTVLWHGDPAADDYVGDPHADEVDPTLAEIGVEEVLAAVAALRG
ncbi:glycosyltransferase family 9 protein [Kineococcus sp. SYSU DK004]|uniref:glycosyltransferase family 9 protein n=1 Tax=Kineococcus sp. SYSU DK004 TaxID=3383125 RepID=UPI003D7E9DD7